MTEQLSLLLVRRRRILLSISQADESEPELLQRLEEHLQSIDERYRSLLSSLQLPPA